MINLIGRVLHNRFRVDAFVASGGMSVVYRVWDLERNVPLAMKVLHLDLQDDPSITKRFQREARALQKLAHPHIVPFYGLYQSHDLTFLVEQYVDGPSLKHILRQRRGYPMPVAEALVYLKALTTALGYAHTYDVVHCDVKPGNVMIDRVGNIFLTDFGVARHAESTTTTIGAAGTPAYMAPEQIRGEPVTAATDVYALGILIFELLTGQRPFAGTETGSDSSGGTAAERVRYAHMMLSPPDPRQLNPDIPEALAHVILRAMNKAPYDRYSSMQEMLDAACDAAGLTPAHIPDRVTPPEIEEGPIAATMAVPQPYAQQQAYAQPQAPAPAWQNQPTWVYMAVGAVAVLILLFGMVFLGGGIDTVRGFFASDTPTPRNTAAYTSTLALTWTPSFTHTIPFTQTDRPTYTPLPTYTDRPTDTLRPTDTERPRVTDTPRPTQKPVSSTYRVTIKNNSGAPVYVFMDGRYLGGPVSAYGYMWFQVKPGSHSFYVCRNSNGTNCSSSKSHNVNQDVEIAFQL
jgi:serine/threonine protein kinase